MQFREWFIFNENSISNVDISLATIFKYAKPDEKHVLDQLVKEGLISQQQDNQYKLREDYAKIIMNVLGRMGRQNLNWLSFSLGYLASKKFREEDLEMAINVFEKLKDSGEIKRSDIGLKGWMLIGTKMNDMVAKFIKDSQQISNRQSLRMKKTGETLDDDERFIKLVAQEENVKLYHLPPIGAGTEYGLPRDKEEINARGRILCKYGKGTSWCTATPGGSYHEHYLKSNIYIVHVDDKPVYQFVDCKDPDSQTHQFMDVDDQEVSSITNRIFRLIDKHADTSCYEFEIDGYEDIEDYLSTPSQHRSSLSPSEVYGFLIHNIEDPMKVIERLGEDARIVLFLDGKMFEKILSLTPKKEEFVNYFLSNFDKLYHKGEIAKKIIENSEDRKSIVNKLKDLINRNADAPSALLYAYLQEKGWSFSGSTEFDELMTKLINEGFELPPESVMSYAYDKVAMAEFLGPKINKIIGKSEMTRTKSGTTYPTKIGMDYILAGAKKDKHRLAEIFMKLYDEIDREKAKILIRALPENKDGWADEAAVKRLLKEKSHAMSEELRTELEKDLERMQGNKYAHSTLFRLKF